MTLPQRLGRNHGGYRGESVDIGAVLQQDLEAATQFGWHVEQLVAATTLPLLAFRRTFGTPQRRLYLSTGIHGDEPAGPLAVRQMLQENRWPQTTAVWLCPCLNPTGFPLNRRENALGFDLNRDYRHLESAEVRAHVGWLRQQPPFDLTVCVHEDWEAQGFYLYELNPDHQPSLAETIIEAVAAVCPIDPAPVIDGRPAHHGIIRPDLDPAQRPQWPEAFYLLMNQTRHSYTLEAPSDFPLRLRVRALIAALRAVLDAEVESKPTPPQERGASRPEDRGTAAACCEQTDKDRRSVLRARQSPSLC